MENTHPPILPLANMLTIINMPPKNRFSLWLGKIVAVLESVDESLHPLIAVAMGIFSSSLLLLSPLASTLGEYVIVIVLVGISAFTSAAAISLLQPKEKKFSTVKPANDIEMSRIFLNGQTRNRDFTGLMEGAWNVATIPKTEINFVDIIDNEKWKDPKIYHEILQQLNHSMMAHAHSSIKIIKYTECSLYSFFDFFHVIGAPKQRFTVLYQTQNGLWHETEKLFINEGQVFFHELEQLIRGEVCHVPRTNKIIQRVKN